VDVVPPTAPEKFAVGMDAADHVGIVKGLKFARKLVPAVRRIVLEKLVELMGAEEHAVAVLLEIFVLQTGNVSRNVRLCL